MSSRPRGAPTKPSGNRAMGIVLGGIVAVSFSYPFWLLLSNSSGSDSGRIDPTKGKLPGQAKIRGAFLNTGSKDFGPDPNATTYLPNKEKNEG